MTYNETLTRNVSTSLTKTPIAHLSVPVGVPDFLPAPTEFGAARGRRWNHVNAAVRLRRANARSGMRPVATKAIVAGSGATLRLGTQVTVPLFEPEVFAGRTP